VLIVQINLTTSIIRDYFKNFEKIIHNLDISKIERLIELLKKTQSLKKTVFLVGNGGSASTASHFATDIGIGSLRKQKLLRVISLCDNSAVVTAISNDFEYEAIFEQQLRLLGEPGDLLILFTASGNSKNLVRVFEYAKSKGITVFSFTGFDGGVLKKLTSPNNIHIETAIGSYGLVEDLHLAVCHVVTECIRAE
jgi:D-sedoheptulose 7-phosphate isomerase